MSVGVRNNYLRDERRDGRERGRHERDRLDFCFRDWGVSPGNRDLYSYLAFNEKSRLPELVCRVSFKDCCGNSSINNASNKVCLEEVSEQE